MRQGASAGIHVLGQREPSGQDGWMNDKKWADLSPAKQAGIGLLGVLEIGLLVAAQIDLTRRSAEQVNGPKPLWRVLSFVNFIGPLAYFTIGRRR